MAFIYSPNGNLASLLSPQSTKKDSLPTMSKKRRLPSPRATPIKRHKVSSSHAPRYLTPSDSGSDDDKVMTNSFSKEHGSAEVRVRRSFVDAIEAAQYIQDQRQIRRQLGLDSEYESDTDLQPRFANANEAAQYAQDQRQLRHQLDVYSDDQAGSEMDIDEDLKNVSISVSDFHLGEDSFTQDDGDELDTNITTPDKSAQWVQPHHKVAPLPSDASFSSVSAERLRAIGYSEDHIQLISLLELRGHQTILPQEWKKPLEFLPRVLFTDDSQAFMSSNYTSLIHAEDSFCRMLKLGGCVRSSVAAGSPPEKQVAKALKGYIKWATRDSGLDKHVALPIVKVIAVPRTVNNETLVARATRSMAHLSQKWHQALQAHQFAIGAASYEMPTLYTIIASHRLLALATLKPSNDTLQSSAFFDYDDVNSDFWTSLALMIIVCHARNMQMRIAEETGLGTGRCKKCEEEDIDPDL